ncbi:hypothetical protein JMJ35_006278 [Cladonia borealis]|uniref:Mediator of RNA polymerase II transcription subunit 22 n=1 Tax=Cladonia borealis TaxID=184061 RepID=A0AA39QYW4_9LECA|nr:hypothetical protein JMJ35_006278 [Cladonia borealis]
MEQNQRTESFLLDRANNDISQLLKRFENIIAFSPEKHMADRNAAAVRTYVVEVETAALVRAAEDILSLTRELKESWLFGKLQTVGTSEAEKRAEEAAAQVAAGLARLEAMERGAAGTGTGPGIGSSNEQAMDIDSYDNDDDGYGNGHDP